jgi:hypothetical protein
MALIHEQTTLQNFEVELTVSERQKHETREPWRFITLHYDSFEQLTPTDLRELGRWLAQEGRRIGRQYKSNGAPKEPTK